MILLFSPQRTSNWLSIERPVRYVKGKLIYLGFNVALNIVYRSYHDSCFMGGGNHYIQLVKVLYCKQLTIGKQLPTFPHRLRGLNRRPQRWEASVLPLQVMFKQRNLNSKNTTQPDRSLYQCGWVRVVFERDTVYTCHIIIKYKEMKGLTVE